MHIRTNVLMGKLAQALICSSASNPKPINEHVMTRQKSICLFGFSDFRGAFERLWFLEYPASKSQAIVTLD